MQHNKTFRDKPVCSAGQEPIRLWRQRGRTSIQFLLCMAISLLLAFPVANAMEPISDSEMSNITGQALIMTSKTQGTGISSNTTFYKMGLDAALNLNVNMKKLQLGCGGINGPGCDINIDNFSLHGTPGVNGCSPSGGTANCDMTLTRPSITLAIQNDGSATARKMIGFMFSAENMTGQLTAGVNDGTENGINAMSGYFKIASGPGYAVTAADNIDVSHGELHVPICVTIFGGCVANGTAESSSGSIIVPGLGDPNNPKSGVAFVMPSFAYYGYRGFSGGNTEAKVNNIQATLPDISLTDPSICPAHCKNGGQGPVDLLATVWGINITEKAYMSGVIQNMKANFDLTEPLGYFHLIPIDSPAQLSFQSKAVLWPGQQAAYHSQRGWFMYIKNPIVIATQSSPLTTPIGTAVPIKSVENDNAIMSAVNDYFSTHKIEVSASSAIGGAFGADLQVPLGNLDFSSLSPTQLSLVGLPLGTSQTPPQNCYGNYTFC